MKQLEHLQYYKRVIVSTIIINNKTDERDPKTIENLLICNEIFIHTYTYIYNHRKTHTRKEKGNLFIPKNRAERRNESSVVIKRDSCKEEEEEKKAKRKKNKKKEKRKSYITEEEEEASEISTLLV